MRTCLGPRGHYGQGMTEYIIIVALIAVAAIGVFMFFGKTVREQGAGIANEIAGNQANNAAAKDATTKASAEAGVDKGLGNYNNAPPQGGAGN